MQSQYGKGYRIGSSLIEKSLAPSSTAQRGSVLDQDDEHPRATGSGARFGICVVSEACQK